MRRLTLALTVMTLLLIESRTAQSQSVPLLDKVIEALGGASFRNVREITSRGEFFAFQNGTLTGKDVFLDYIKFPDKERTEFGKGSNAAVTINNGASGWAVENKKTTLQSPDQAKEFEEGFKISFDYVIRFTANDSRATVSQAGSEHKDSIWADILEIKDTDGNLITFYLDRQSHLPMKMQVRRAQKTEVYEEVYADYRKIQGVMTPMFLSRYKDGAKTMDIRIDSVKFNSGISDSLFTPPK